MDGRQIRGSCLCGAVGYTLPDRLRYALYCHCSRCRRRTGSAFSAFGGIEAEALAVTHGADRVSIYESLNVYNHFCSLCGSPLFAVFKTGEMVHVQLGTLIDAPSIRPSEHIFAADNADWHEIADTLPKHAGYST